jgi:KipI family sensor histidine kinase inhibitor
MQVRAAGDAALLLATGTRADQDGNGAATVAALIRAADLPGVIDVVPGAATVLVSVEPGSWALPALAARLTELATAAAGEQVTAAAGADETIDVCYDGPDLADVASLTGLSIADVISRHQAAEYRVGWLGFAPGFAYLTGLDPLLASVPRLDTPRLRVPAGSVAIAGGLAAVYPAGSPGGWRLLGRTTARLWDPDRDPPALLAPGTLVRFRAVDSLPAQLGRTRLDQAPLDQAPLDQAPLDQAPLDQAPLDQARANRPEPDLAAPDHAVPDLAAHGGAATTTTGAERRVEVLQPGPLTTVQDLGRAGLAHLGVPASGAADVSSLRLANSLVGNEAGAACLEVTLGRLTLRFDSAAAIAVTGAPVPVIVGNEEFGTGTAVAVPAGSVLRLGAPATGLRSYVAIDGGIGVPPVLGSRSADCLSGLGPRPLRPGDWLPVERPRSPLMKGLRPRPRAVGPVLPAAGTPELRVIAGPRDDWFGAAALDVLAAASFAVTPASNRTGLRLSGPALRRSRPGELPSEGMAAGSIQVTHEGQLILLLADRPTTGGYPVIAVVAAADLGLAAQLRPGQQVLFRVSQGLAWPPAGSAG